MEGHAKQSISRRTFLKFAVLSSLSGALTLVGCSFGSNMVASQEESHDGQTSASSPDGGQEMQYNSVFPQHEPLGVAQGIHPGRVVWSYDPSSVRWDGSTPWWEIANYDERTVVSMTERALIGLTGATTLQQSWNQLFQYANRHQSDRTNDSHDAYQSGQTVLIKCNMNGAAEYDDDTTGTSTQDMYANPVFTRALVASLVHDGGVPADHILLYDTTRIFPDFFREYLSSNDLKGVRFADRRANNPDVVSWHSDNPITWSGKVNGEPTYYPDCVIEADYIINLADLKGHDYGITLCAKNHFGSFCNSSKMRQPQAAGLHPFLSNQNRGDYSPLVDLMGSYALGGKTILNILCALVAPAQNTQVVSKEISTWSMDPFNGGYTCSIFMSQDPVAIDSVGADFLINEPGMTDNNSQLKDNAGCENYLHEAALADNPPSGTSYTDGLGNRLSSLGVHEHWNNAYDKQYSRNLGTGEGIELVRA